MVGGGWWAVTFSWFGQFSGNNVASYYLPQMVANVGVTKTETVLLLNAIYAIVGWIAAGTGARLHDVLGRRKVYAASPSSNPPRPTSTLSLYMVSEMIIPIHNFLMRWGR